MNDAISTALSAALSEINAAREAADWQRMTRATQALRSVNAQMDVALTEIKNSRAQA